MKADLSVGSPAPSLAKASWIQGTPLSSFRPGKMHIVIVFGTRCGSCPGALIAMERLQEKYKDIGVELIGFSNDKAATADAARARVDEWLSENIPNSNIPIAFDHTGEVLENWMEASWSFQYPRTFVVDRDGSIVFIGYPDELESAFPKVIDGSWLTSPEGEQAEKERLAECLIDRTDIAIQLKDWKTARSAVDEGIKTFPDESFFPQLHVTLIIETGDMEAGWDALRRFARDAVEKNSVDWLLAAIWQLFNAQYDYSRFPSEERFSLVEELSDRILASCYHESGQIDLAVEVIEQVLESVRRESLPNEDKEELLAQLLQKLVEYKQKERSQT
ncbi:redoxin family protein [Rhizobium leguminosarum]|uniref:redoxin family protein n=1 Tax=Rhizobium leguminosarum TaxID=384 RepID=UPI001AE4DE01|nr:redoxin family protein [Rhizobium leguminosarum]MBP2444019.1 alkyl hydroperoxide reductase subunit AhpC [Rhizobium leguminosarum]